MKKINNIDIPPIYVIGGNHHNMLGIIRMLGEVGINTNAIIKGNSTFSFCKKSKYLIKCDFVNNDEEMLEKLKSLKVKSIIIPTGDESAYLLDKNYDILKDSLIIPSINEKNSQMDKYMDKYFQNKFLKELGIKVVASQEIDLNNFKISDLILKYPIILKPQLSIDGNKSDITIVNDKNELDKSLKEFNNKNYVKVLAQEFIKMDYECGLNGVCYKNKVIMPAILKKIRIYPKNKGNVSYGKVIMPKNSKLNLNPIKDLLIKLNYNGFYDIELFVIDDDYYLNEINFRNSGNSYVYTKGNVNLALLWIYMNLNISIDNMEKEVIKDYYFTDEIGELKQLKNRNINLLTYIQALCKSKSFFLINFKDPKPFFYKLIIAIKHKLGVVKDEL